MEYRTFSVANAETMQVLRFEVVLPGQRVPEWGEGLHVIDLGMQEDPIFPQLPHPGAVLIHRNQQLDWADPREDQAKRDDKWEEIKDVRAGLLAGGFTWQDAIFQTDPDSVMVLDRFIARANTAGDMSDVSFVLANNEVRQMSPEDWVTFGVAFHEWLDAIQARSQELRKQIYSLPVDKVGLLEW